MWAIWRPDARAVLRNKKARASLARYFDVMEDDRPAKFLIAKKLPANFDKVDISATTLTQAFHRLSQPFRREDVSFLVPLGYGPVLTVETP